MTTKSFHQQFIQILKDKGPLTAGDLLMAMRERGLRRTPSMPSLSNILSRRPEFENLGTVEVRRNPYSSDRYKVILWGLTYDAWEAETPE